MAENQRESHAGLLIAALVLLLLLFAGFVFVFASMSVAGTASLPNGANLSIQGPFSASVTPEKTMIDFAGCEIDFTKTEVSVDGTRVGLLDGDVQLWQLSEDEQGAPVLSSETRTILLAP